MELYVSHGHHRKGSPVLVLGGLLAIELGVLVWLTRYDANEGWYALYPSMVLDGQLPYRDFFYHRLPLLPFVFTLAVAMPFSMLISVRIMCAVFTWVSWWLSAATAESWTGTVHARVWVLVLGLVSFYGNSYLVTAQSYAPFALFIALAVWFMSMNKGVGTPGRFACAGIMLAAAMGLRFGPDALLIVVPAAIFLQRLRKEARAKFSALIITFSLSLAIIFLLSVSWDAEAFFWGVFIWPFKFWDYLTENGFIPGPIDLQGYIRFKAKFTLIAFENFLPIVLAGLLGFMVHLHHGGFTCLLGWVRRRGSTELLAWILVAANIVFFLLAASSGIMQYAFILPLTAACIVTFTRDGLLSVGWRHLSAATSVPILCAALVVGLIGDTPLSCSWRHPGPDVTVLADVSRKLSEIIGPDQYVVTFDPVLAANAKRRVFPGFEFELYGFYPNWDRQRAERFKVYNWPMLKDALISPRTGAVVFTLRRLSDDHGMGRLLEPYQQEIVSMLEQSFRLVAHIEVPACVAVGTVKVYKRRTDLDQSL